jgi:catechol 2,3-dioxygenase-like lactoylglutathione lyase family enzyme
VESGFSRIRCQGAAKHRDDKGLMNSVARPQIRCEQHHATLSVSDVQASAEFYATKLGFVVAFSEGDPPTFAGVNFDGVQIFLTQGQPAPQACSVYFVVDDADGLYAWHRSNGVEIVEPPRDQPYRLREYAVRDLDGYCLYFGHRLPDAGVA